MKTKLDDNLQENYQLTDDSDEYDIFYQYYKTPENPAGILVSGDGKEFLKESSQVGWRGIKKRLMKEYGSSKYDSHVYFPPDYKR